MKKHYDDSYPHLGMKKGMGTEAYKPTDRPRPREATFIPQGIRKDVKIKMHDKLS
ncbi:MAG: hypothetical protein M0Z31_14905 [Clostridia bacterium]|nr:hypothetical protein [Clostridia bacterium]